MKHTNYYMLYSLFDDVMEIEHMGESKNASTFEAEMRLKYPEKFEDKSICLYILQTKALAKPLKMNWEKD